MEEKKLTDEEIIEALEDMASECETNFSASVVDLIHRLQEENERLSEKAVALEVETNNQKAEIERLASVNMQTIGKNAELLLKVDELKEKSKKVNELVKDTAKEIYELLEKWVWKLKNEKGSLGKFRFAIETVMQEIKEKYLLEVANFKLVELKKGERK